MIMITGINTGKDGQIEAITFSHAVNLFEWLAIIHMLLIVMDEVAGEEQRSHITSLVLDMLPTDEQCRGLYYKPNPSRR
jgi:hypothetical protein